MSSLSISSGSSLKELNFENTNIIKSFSIHLTLFETYSCSLISKFWKGISIILSLKSPFKSKNLDCLFDEVTTHNCLPLADQETQATSSQIFFIESLFTKYNLFVLSITATMSIWEFGLGITEIISSSKSNEFSILKFWELINCNWNLGE